MSQQVYSNQEKKYPLKLTDGSLRLITDQELKTTSNVTFASVNVLPGPGNVVTNAGTSVDNAIARFDGTTGKIIQNSTAYVNDAGDVMSRSNILMDGGGAVSIQASPTSASYVMVLPVAQGAANTVLTNDGAGALTWSTNGVGDVLGPTSSTDNAAVRFDGTTGKLVQNSLVTIGDTGIVTAAQLSSRFMVNGGTIDLTSGRCNINVPLDMGGAQPIRLYHTSNGQSVSISAPGVTSSYSLTMPTTQGAANSILTNNGSGALTWATSATLSTIAATTSLTTPTITSSSALDLSTTTPNDLSLSPGGNGAVIVNKNNNTSPALSIRYLSLANPTLIITPGGALDFGPGSTTFDSILQRHGVAELKVTDSSGSIDPAGFRVGYVTTNSINKQNTALDGNNVVVGPIGTGIRLSGVTSGTFSVKAADTTTSYEVKLPSVQGGVDSLLSNDGSGNLSWLDAVPRVSTPAWTNHQGSTTVRWIKTGAKTRMFTTEGAGSGDMTANGEFYCVIGTVADFGTPYWPNTIPVYYPIYGTVGPSFVWLTCYFQVNGANVEFRVFRQDTGLTNGQTVLFTGALTIPVMVD